jgi:hypothetical protein
MLFLFFFGIPYSEISVAPGKLLSLTERVIKNKSGVIQTHEKKKLNKLNNYPNN